MEQEVKEVKKFVERITSISQTVRKQGKNVLKFIESTIKNFIAAKNLN